MSFCTVGRSQSQDTAYWMGVKADCSSIPASVFGSETFLSARREHAYRVALTDFRWIHDL